MQELLRDLKPTKDYLVCIDSDGCILDNMELKHKECFCPATVNVWQLQGVSRYVRETAEFVNLYSRTRGTNRFPAIIRTLELAHERPELRDRGYVLPDLRPLRQWIERTPVLSAAALEAYVRDIAAPTEVLNQAVDWSREVDENIARVVRNVQPFPHVREAIARLREFADVVVVSATPHEALTRELRACGIDKLVSAIAGQEMGTKAQCIQRAMEGKYSPDHTLKIGDAPSDLAAARENGVLFHPILPGQETESWRRVLEESSDRFRQSTFGGGYMEEQIQAFFTLLPENPPWGTGG